MNTIIFSYISGSLVSTSQEFCVANTMSWEKQVTFSSTSFAEGRFRRAYKGTWEKPRCYAGRKCVVKECKKNYTWKATDWDTTVKVTEKAKELASAFNTKTGTSRPITYTDVHVLKVTRQNSNSTPKLNEYVTCEDYIDGEYNKWCNNYGYIDTSFASMPAFMHWTWWYTDGELMIADLQGVRKDDSYLLTDPVIMSLSGNYGETDTGVEGMALFFLSHKCGLFCDKLPKPTLRDFYGIIPQPYLQAAQSLLAQIQSSTTYRAETKFPQDIRQKVAAVFRRIARN